MNKSEHRHQLIRALVTKNKIHTQAELQALLADNDIQVTQATLSRDIKKHEPFKSTRRRQLLLRAQYRLYLKMGETSRNLHGRCSCLDASRSTPSPP